MAKRQRRNEIGALLLILKGNALYFNFRVEITVDTALLIFGPSKLPEIARGLGKAIRNFRSSASGLNEVDITPKENKDELEAEKRKLNKDK